MPAAVDGQASLHRRTALGLQQRAVDEQINQHSERYLLAFVYGTLREHDLLGVRTEAEKYLLLATLNLVECIAATANEATAPTPR